MMISTNSAIAHSVGTICATVLLTTFITLTRGGEVKYENHVIKLLPLESVRVATSGNLSTETSYVLFQAHTQLDDVIMSYKDVNDDGNIPLDQMIRGRNIGLVVHLEEDQIEAFVYVKNPCNKIVNALIITSAHPFQDPVPGGCNMEFNVETSPFLRLKSNKLRNRIEWQPAAIGSSNGNVARRRRRKRPKFDQPSNYYHSFNPLLPTSSSSSPEEINLLSNNNNSSSDHSDHRSGGDHRSSGHSFLYNSSTVATSRISFDTYSEGPSRSCDTSYNFISYQIYSYYLRENDYSEEEYFRGIRLMSNPKMVVKYAKSRESMAPTTPSITSRTKSLFLSYPGRGVIFSVLCFTITSSSANPSMVNPISIIPLVNSVRHSPPRTYLNGSTVSPRFNHVVSRIATLYVPPEVDDQTVASRSVAYVPIATYNCDLKQGPETCGKLSGIWNVLFVSLLAISGLILALRGHQWFDFQVVWTSFVLTAILSFILITKYSNFTHLERDILVVICSVTCSCLWLFLWKLIGSPILTLLTSGLLLGFLVSASVLFTALGNDDIFRNDLNYWLIMGCGSIIIPIALIPFAVLMSVFSCSIVGSYALVFTVDRFVGGSVSFIIINVFKRAIYSHDVDNELYQALNDVPIQGKDIILLVTWSIFSLIGMCLQVYNSLDQPPFPSNNRSCCRPRVVDLNTVTISSSSRARRRSRRSSGRSRRRESRSRNSSIGSGVRVRSRSTRRNAQATVIDPSVSNIVGASSGTHVVIVRPSAPPTEAAEEIRPLLCDAAPIHGHNPAHPPIPVPKNYNSTYNIL